MAKFAAIPQPCSRQGNSPRTKSYNVSMLMMAHSHLAREKTSSVVWNSSSTTSADLVWKCISAEGHHRPKLNAFSSPLPSSFNMCNPQCCRHDDPTCLPLHTYQYPPTPTHRATCTKLDLPNRLSHWLSRCRRIVPPNTRRQRRNSMQIDPEICLIHSQQEFHRHHPHTPQVTCRLPP